MGPRAGPPALFTAAAGGKRTSPWPEDRESVAALVGSSPVRAPFTVPGGAGRAEAALQRVCPPSRPVCPSPGRSDPSPQLGPSRSVAAVGGPPVSWLPFASFQPYSLPCHPAGASPPTCHPLPVPGRPPHEQGLPPLPQPLASLPSGGPVGSSGEGHNPTGGPGGRRGPSPGTEGAATLRGVRAEGALFTRDVRQTFWGLSDLSPHTTHRP